jgi:hypothetical protein
MKTTAFPALLCLSIALAQPLLAGQSKPSKQDTTAANEKLVSALIAVSPDSLGGRLGLELATGRTAVPEIAAASRRTPTRTFAIASDNQDYQAWKPARKS